MEFLYALIGIVAIIVLFPYIRCFVKRLSCAGKIKKLCREKGYKMHAAHPLWFLGGKHGAKCDLYVETANEVFAVKLFGMPRRRRVLIFKENGEYFIRRFIGFSAYGSAIRYPIDGRSRRLPQYDFRYKYRDEWEIKTPRHILLVNPISMEIRRQPKNGAEVIVGAGDTVNGMEIESLSRFLGDLESAI
ncbi:MAG: hypothetical protein IKJ80_00280 [Clostridia bacterium]|nr:hypothetical protein [Clostridia bacterium]